MNSCLASLVGVLNKDQFHIIGTYHNQVDDFKPIQSEKQY